MLNPFHPLRLSCPLNFGYKMNDRFDLYSLPMSLLRSIFEDTLYLCDIAKLISATNGRDQYRDAMGVLDGCIVVEMNMCEDYTHCLLNWCLNHNIGALHWMITNLSCSNMQQVCKYVVRFGSPGSARALLRWG